MPDPSRYLPQKIGQKVSRAAATLPQGTAAAIFTISGGRVLIYGIIGTVTVVMGATANAIKLTANPTATSVASVDIAAASASTANDPVGTMYGLTGTFATALQKGGAVSLPALPIVCVTGTIDLDCAGSNSGQAKWDLWYLPLDAGAKVVAA